MKAEIKILHTQSKLTVKGKPYQIVHVLVKLGHAEFVRKFYVFQGQTTEDLMSDL